MNQHRLSIGISACLSGESVRYDGGHKSQPLIVEALAANAELLPFCPEVAASLGIPRPPVQLVTTSGGKRALGVTNPDLDVTTALTQTTQTYCDQIEALSLSGFILKSRSPSCGLGSTPVYGEGPTRYGNGLFAEGLRRSAPWLACVEEDWLVSKQRCRRFLTACAIVAFTHHGQSAYADLPQPLKRELGVTEEELVDALLSDTDVLEKEAALDERLACYWSGR